MRKYSKVNTKPDHIEEKIKKIEEEENIIIEAVLEIDETGIYPVIKFSNKN